MPCPCDTTPHPPPPAIPAGLDWLPRQPADAAAFRRALLSDASRTPALAGWRADTPGDLGVMVLEMGAYVAAVLAFYDEVVANELYLRTARRDPDVRRLVELLGYRPRPAVAATALMAVWAEGRRPVSVPTGTAFRSAAFGDEAPQVFEVTADAVVHPLLNGWALAPPVPETLGDALGTGGTGADVSLDQILIDPAGPQPVAGAPLLVRARDDDALTAVTVASRLEKTTGADGEPYVRVELDPAIALSDDVAPDEIALSRPTRSASLWTMTDISGDPDAVEDAGGVTWLTLDGLYRLVKPGGFVVVEKAGALRWFRVTETAEVSMHVTVAGLISLTDTDDSTVSVAVPATTTPVTRLKLDALLNDTSRTDAGGATWDNGDAATLVVHHHTVGAGALRLEASTTVTASSALALAAPPEVPADGSEPGALVLRDVNGDAVALDAALDFETGAITPGQGSAVDRALQLPVKVLGNLVESTRGETVEGETLGSGDASVANQSFRLKKNPLTYVSAPTSEDPAGVASTLTVWVDGVRWDEVPSFFGLGPFSRVYTVRHDDEGVATVTFGDGVRGARLPTGTDNVVASYRHGAGAAAPPAEAINQLARPTVGIQRVENPLAAFGGADAEGPDEVRTLAPASALLLGRAVSILDMETVAAGVAGVRAAQARWRWRPRGQGAEVHVWFLGDAALAPTVAAALAAATEPDVPSTAEAAASVPVAVSLDVAVDERYVEGDVVETVRRSLVGEGGALTPEVLGIGRPVYRSALYAAVLAVPGAVSVRALAWGGAPFGVFAQTPGAGAYFDVKAGGLTLNGTPVLYG
jgi:predicted phage baseplate assembly protein